MKRPLPERIDVPVRPRPALINPAILEPNSRVFVVRRGLEETYPLVAVIEEKIVQKATTMGWKLRSVDGVHASFYKNADYHIHPDYAVVAEALREDIKFARRRLYWRLEQWDAAEDAIDQALKTEVIRNAKTRS